MTISERKITMSELRERYAKGEFVEMFGTGTAAVITPVGELQYKEQTFKFTYSADSLTNRLYEEFCQIQYGEIADRHQWLMAIET